ncbi:hypothetical protein TNCV_2744321 [Trichonephila clavipes]|nr:hypothetical protein TNCV_2744321 [Trichonephila clavipes]
MSPGRCNTGLTTSRYTESNYQSDLREYYTTHEVVPSEAPVDRWDGNDGLQFVGQAYPTHALWDSSPNDIPIDMACHRYTLNMQVSPGTKNNSSPNARAILLYHNGVVQ